MEFGEVVINDAVRVFDKEGNEVVIWTWDEVRENPQEVVTAIVEAVILVEHGHTDDLKKMIGWVKP